MLDFFQGLFDSGFMPHGHCYQWRPDLVWLHAVSDSMIAAAYYAIPFALVYFVRRRKDLAFPWMFGLFGAFILFCGTTHLLEVYTIWHGTYRLTGVVKFATGLVSVSTAFLLFPLVPRALALPSTAQLQAANEALRQQIAQRRAAEQALRESEKRFRRAFDYAAIGKALVSAEGRFLEVNQALAAMLGCSAEALRALTFQDFTHPEDLSEDLHLLREIIEGRREAYRIEKRYVRQDGGIVWALLSVSAVRAEDGAFQYFISEIQDISKAKSSEEALRGANAALEARNQELQEFSYVASHDLQEPLRKVSTFADLVLTDYGAALPEEGRRHLERIRASALRMTDLLRGLLSYSRVNTQAGAPEAVDMNHLVKHVLSDLEVAVAESGARVAVEPLPAVLGDATQLRQLFQNLMENAIKFAKDGTAPEITISAPGFIPGEEMKPGQMRRIEVADKGIGFDEKYLDRIFLPFERLHGRERYKGTGMGLAICRRIAVRHGGSITATSREGAGATIIVHLPGAAPPAG